MASVTLQVCWRCNGTGIYRWGGGTVNGRFVGKEGACFKCVGGGEFPVTNGAAWFTKFGPKILASVERMAHAALPDNPVVHTSCLCGGQDTRCDCYQEAEQDIMGLAEMDRLQS